LGQELPAFLLLLATVPRSFELGTGPEDGSLGRRVETLRVEHGALVMVAQKNDLALHHQVHAFARIGPIADNVAQAIDFLDVLPGDIGQNGLECFEIAMDIADQRLHWNPPGTGATADSFPVVSRPAEVIGKKAKEKFSPKMEKVSSAEHEVQFY